MHQFQLGGNETGRRKRCECCKHLDPRSTGITKLEPTTIAFPFKADPSNGRMLKLAAARASAAAGRPVRGAEPASQVADLLQAPQFGE